MSTTPSSTSSSSSSSTSPPLSPALLAKLKEQRLVSKQIEKQLKTEKKIMDSELKLLLLGTGDSGKSTVVKQMKILHLKGYSEEERKNLKSFVYRNLIEILQSLIYGCSILNLEIQDKDQSLCTKINDIYESKNYSSIDLALYKELCEFSKDKSLQHALHNSGSHFQIHSSSHYFLNEFPRFLEASYIPTDQDILHTRVSTSAVTETKFNVRGINFRMIDVGGQRGHRDKWIHHFSDVTAILFVISLSEYDQVLEEDNKTNRMLESIKVFTDIINQRWFAEVPIILFLNKCDLFAEKIRKTSIKICFPDYAGTNDYDECIQFIKKKILLSNKTPKTIYTHVTTATDTNNIGAVFEAVKDILTRQTMEEGGI
ncbi:hypothetical protein CYY_006052 [Polysphondylium violaceum]|uniref:Uncharacterized protein n=1 Tax=Polysphondylium violaceum TaxID=133409 RepID=A0A8J4V6A4_9MYCE|nr:hypothetical protein CYY_006052 [Polysphondylium violaceum]